ncbi:MAG: hypothetical protein HY057_14360 [Rhodospirillales bacterium]|nr:hypothetical protein [Rhodospirillales bacterium]
MKTTLRAIRDAGPCKDSWVALLAGLGKTEADDAPLSLLDILRILGLDDTEPQAGSISVTIIPDAKSDIGVE